MNGAEVDRTGRRRCIVGIDLGTTNCACAWVDTEKSDLPIAIFPVLQLVEPSVTAELELLPSFLYLAAGHEVPPGSLDLPWAKGRDFVVGELARKLGARAPGRLIASAKSWLCHGRVRRTQPILPWGAPEGVPKRSPVAVQAAYLAHIREAWKHTRGGDLAQHDVIVTVPASFDEVARHLTLAAAKIAGLERVVLLEEPQAAFYTFLAAHQESWRQYVSVGDTVLVCDIGGGTTDFSLIEVSEGRLGPVFTRKAVGDHILLGGDNMDIALARLCEQRLGRGSLDLASFNALLAQVRSAKEKLLAEDGPDQVTVTVHGRGRKIVGGTATTSLSREEVRNLILERFFPEVSYDAEPESLSPEEVAEFGLPYARDEAVTRHLAAFLRRHTASGRWPQAVLFNGGVMTPPFLQDAVCRVLASWSGREPKRLPNPRLFLAVAYGAAYFGRTRVGQGLRILAGSPRNYYLGVETEEGERALCVVPRGAAEEGQGSFTATEDFTVKANNPVAFKLYSSSSRDDVPGQFVDPADLEALPPLRTLLRYGKKGAQVDVPVQVRVELTEIGTLEVWCRAKHSDHRWRLEFALDDEEGPPAEREPGETVPVELIEAGAKVVREYFSPANPRDPAPFMKALQRACDMEREAWPTSLLRGLWDALWSLAESRRISSEHEARWLHAAGFFLRPGFGDPLDPWRVGRLWRFFSQGPVFPDKTENRVQWWILWRRIAGGLDEEKQLEVYGRLAPVLVRGKGGVDSRQEMSEMWAAAAALELLGRKRKEELGNALLLQLEGGRALPRDVFALARLGAREPLYGPVDAVLKPQTVEKWLRRVLLLKWPKDFRAEYALLHMARYTGDRARDVSEEIREEVAARVERLPQGKTLVESLFQVKPLTAAWEKKVFGDSLPLGLRLKDG